MISFFRHPLFTKEYPVYKQKNTRLVYTEKLVCRKLRAAFTACWQLQGCLMEAQFELKIPPGPYVLPFEYGLYSSKGESRANVEFLPGLLKKAYFARVNSACLKLLV